MYVVYSLNHMGNPKGFSDIKPYLDFFTEDKNLVDEYMKYHIENEQPMCVEIDGVKSPLEVCKILYEKHRIIPCNEDGDALYGSICTREAKDSDFLYRITLDLKDRKIRRYKGSMIIDNIETTNLIEYMPLDMIDPMDTSCDDEDYPIRGNNLNFIVRYKSKVYMDLVENRELLQELLTHLRSNSEPLEYANVVKGILENKYGVCFNIKNYFDKPQLF